MQQRLVVCNAGMAVVVAATAKRFVGRHLHLTVVDFLRPPSLPKWLLRLSLLGVDEFIVIRSGDTDGLAQLGVAREACRFVPFPAPALPVASAPSPSTYVYSGGSAQRDWSTFVGAVELARIPAVVGASPTTASEFAEFVGPLSPEEGRVRMAEATLVALSTFDNHQPAGPLLLLDAMAMGKAIVASDTPAHRDYIDDGVSGLLVPPGDAPAFAEALDKLWKDPDLRQRLGNAAASAAAELTSERFWRMTLG